MCPSQTTQQGVFARDSSGVQSYGRRRRRDLSDSEKSDSNDLKKSSKDTSRLTTRRRQARGRTKEDEIARSAKNDEREMTLSREILVLDINDPEPQKSDLDYTTLNGKFWWFFIYIKLLVFAIRCD